MSGKRFLALLCSSAGFAFCALYAFTVTVSDLFAWPSSCAAMLFFICMLQAKKSSAPKVPG